MLQRLRERNVWKVSGIVPALFVIAAAVLAGAAQTGEGVPGPHTFLAVVRQDGSLIPIAVHDGRDWWNRWPWDTETEEMKALAVPATLEAIPDDWLPPGVRLPPAWVLQRRSGPLIPLRATRPARPSAWNLMETIGIQSDYRVRPADRAGLDDFVEIGVAIAGAGELGRFVSPPRADSRRIIGHLTQRLLTLEKTTIARWLQERRDLPGGDREPVTLSPAYRTSAKEFSAPFHLIKAARPFKGRTYYHLTGEKLYRMGLKDQRDCKLNVSFDGIVVGGADGSIVSEKIAAEAWAEYCGDRASWMLPLATLEWRDRVIWIVRHHLEDGYDYGLLDPDTREGLELKGSWRYRGAGRVLADSAHRQGR